jgi:hypothetical protein
VILVYVAFEYQRDTFYLDTVNVLLRKRTSNCRWCCVSASFVRLYVYCGMVQLDSSDVNHKVCLDELSREDGSLVSPQGVLTALGGRDRNNPLITMLKSLTPLVYLFKWQHKSRHPRNNYNYLLCELWSYYLKNILYSCRISDNACWLISALAKGPSIKGYSKCVAMWHEQVHIYFCPGFPHTLKKGTPVLKPMSAINPPETNIPLPNRSTR